MLFYSTNRQSEPVTAREAVLRGIAPDGGLYMPESIPTLSHRFFESLPSVSISEIALETAAPFFAEDITRSALRNLVEKAFSFDAPLVHLGDNLFSLELFHGPTLAFKDFGARFMAQLFGYFAETMDQELIILTATSGDTGSAVAHGFAGTSGIKVVVLYPSGKVSEIQEQQLTTVGGNVSVLEVLGTFDDCQRMVKEAFLDRELRAMLKLTSANSINISRLIPQTVYFFHAVGALPTAFEHILVSVPSGNFGNLTAAVLAKKMGLSITGFIAATNINDVVPHYLLNGEFIPRASVQTLSNAMDVGNPSNFIRMQELYNHNLEEMRKDITGCHFTDTQTITAIRGVKDTYNYLLDPHGAVAYLGLQHFWGKYEKNCAGIFLETAHPAKFKLTVEQAIGRSITIPERLAACLNKEGLTDKIDPCLDALKHYLIERFC